MSAAVRKLSVRRWWDLPKLKCNHNGIKSRALSVLSVVARCFCMSLLLLFSGAAELCAKPFCFAKLKSDAHQHGYNKKIPAEINTSVAMHTCIHQHTHSYLYIQIALRGEVK